MAMKMNIIRIVFALLLFIAGFYTTKLFAQEVVADNPALEAILAEAGPGTRWGMVVADEEGKIILSINPDGRFMPASNTKIVTTMAGMENLRKIENEGTQAEIIRLTRQPPIIQIYGRGDAFLSSAPDCKRSCLHEIADKIAENTKEISGVIAYGGPFPDERWSSGMGWNNISSASGTAISGLSLDNNIISVTISPAEFDNSPKAESGYYAINNQATTNEGSDSTITYNRLPMSRKLVIEGEIGEKAKPISLNLGVDDPAHFTAWKLEEMLKLRGVLVNGKIPSFYANPMFEAQGNAVNETLLSYYTEPSRMRGVPLFQTSTHSVLDSITLINKESQNLHAELLLRKLGKISGGGSVEDGLEVVKDMLTRAGVKEHEIDLYDGSGMSSYNRVTPSVMVRLLNWAKQQKWGAEWRATLPIGAVDGTLKKRFIATSLAGNIWAKTGTLNGVSALAGYLKAKSGRTLTFAIYANDVPEGVRERAIMDRALLYVAENN